MPTLWIVTWILSALMFFFVVKTYKKPQGLGTRKKRNEYKTYPVLGSFYVGESYLTGVLRSMFAGILFFAVLFSSLFLLSSYFNIVITILVMIIGLGFVIAFLMLRFGILVSVFVLLSVFLIPINFHNQWQEAIVLREKPILKNVDVRSIVKDTTASGYYFKDAQILTKIGTYERITVLKRSDITSYYFVAPIVPDKWKPSDSVELWAVCANSDAKNPCKADWEKNFKAATVFYHKSVEPEYRSAVENAANIHHLNVASKIRFLHWCESPDNELSVTYDKMWRFVYLYQLLWVGCVTLAGFFSYKKYSQKIVY